MPNHVLIVAGDAAARASAEVARSLHFTAVVAQTEEEAIRLLDEQPFSFIAVSGNAASERLRELARTRQPAARVLELPDGNGDDTAVRRLMLRHLGRRGDDLRFGTEERFRFLSTILESFTATLDLREVLRRIVTITREAFRADRAWLLRPVTEQAEFAKIIFSVSSPAIGAAPAGTGPIALAGSQNLIRRAMAAPRPVVVMEGDPDLDPELASRFGMRSQVVQILRPTGEEPWAFGLHQCTTTRQWTEEEIDLFNEIGRYATLALNNTLIHDRAMRGDKNRIIGSVVLSRDVTDKRQNTERISQEGHRAAEELARREVDARMRFETVLETAPVGIAVISADELRFDLANARFMDFAANYGKVSSDTRVVGLRGNEVIPGFESVLKKVAESGEPRTDEELEVQGPRGPMYVNRIISAVRGRFSGVTQSVTVLVQDVSEQVVEGRQSRERETLRRRRAECLAGLGLEKVTVEATFDDLNEPAARVSQAINGSVMIYMYHPQTSELHVAGFAAIGNTAAAFQQYRDYVQRNPYHAGEGLPGTAFQIGRPLFYFDITGQAVIDFGRSPAEKHLIAMLGEESVIACAIESCGDRVGALVISRSDRHRNFAAEDLEFAQSVAERIGAASHIQRLTRMSMEGHRAAEELARREVDARVRFEAVLETAPVGVAVISADELRFDLANARFIDLAANYGKISSDTKVVGLRADDVIPGFERILKSVAESGETRYDDAYQMPGLDKRLHVNRIISASRGRFSGITQSLTVLFQDVTDQVRAKREIEDLARMMAERSARLDSILGSMTDGLWVYDANGQVVDVNQAALTMFGLGSRTEAVENASFARFEMRYPDGRPVPNEDLPQSRALRGQTVPDYLAMGRHILSAKDLDLSIAAAPIESNGIVGAVLVIRDITALQELDRKKDEFLSVASHELRTPLTTIKGYTQLLAQTVNDLPPQERATYINAVLGEIDRMMGLISELLDVSRIETNRLLIHPQQIRWIDFLERRASAFRVQNPSRTINFAAEAQDTVVEADPDRMRQVIDNLLSNALKYSAEGSAVDVRVAFAHGVIKTSVVDRGIGIPRDEIPQLFERFHRARNVSSRYYGGLGLGLYIARAIVEAHRGSITVESEEGKGSAFTVTLPQA